MAKKIEAPAFSEMFVLIFMTKKFQIQWRFKGGSMTFRGGDVANVIPTPNICNRCRQKFCTPRLPEKEFRKTTRLTITKTRLKQEQPPWLCV